MRTKKFDLIFFVLLAVFLINLLQALMTPVGKDEAYYYMYAKNPAWGYFDHPPMIAWMIGAGDFFFDGILAVRLLSVLSSVILIFLMWKLLPGRGRMSFLPFVLLIWSIPVFHIYGFISTPDVPLLFFGAVFLLCLRFFYKKNSLSSALLSGVGMALLMYSKYHGALLILFAVLLLPKWWKRSYLLMSVLVGFVLYIPHLYWQWQHDFISLRFHLSERDIPLSLSEKLKMSFPGMLLIINPLLLYFFVKSFVTDIKPDRQEAVKYYGKLFLAITGFFVIYAFISWVQAHWIAVAAIPFALYLSGYYAEQFRPSNRFVIWLYVSIILILSVRLLLMLPVRLDTEFHRENKAFFDEIKNLAGNKRVVFVNSYQRAAKYSFYTSDSAFSWNNIFYRKNQYDLWDYDGFHGKDVILIGVWPAEFYQIKRVGEDTIFYTYINDFQVFNRLKTQIMHKERLLASDTLVLEVENPHRHDLRLDTGEGVLLHLSVKIGDKWQHYALQPVEKPVVKKKSRTLLSFRIVKPLNPDVPAENYIVTGYFKGFYIKTGR